MHPCTILLHMALALSSVMPVVSAWPNWLPQRDSLIVRAKGDDVTATQTSTAAEDTSTTPKETGSATKGAKPTATESGTATASDDKKTTSSSKHTSPTKHSKFPADVPLGGVTMFGSAAATSVTALFRTDDTVTFSWNYTSLLGTPTAVDVFAVCPKAAATVTMTANMSFATPASYVWDISKAQQPLLTAEYYLLIKDSDTAIGDPIAPGYLAASQALGFGLYAPKPYKNWTDWTCPGCYTSAAAPLADAKAVVNLALAMSVVTFFTWFSAGMAIN